MSDKVANQSNWYTMTLDEVGKELKVDPAKGLDSAEIQPRLQKFGPNKLEEKKKEPVKEVKQEDKKKAGF